MPITSVAAFVHLLDQYGLVDPVQRPEVARLAQDGPKDVRGLARELVQRGWLTPYQVNQLSQDNGASLQLGNYVVLERLGSGGMGNVLKARHQKLGRIVALKIIHRDKLSNPAVVKRFQREIRVAARLNHPNIVHAYDAEEVNGAQVLVMEYLEGTDLGKTVKENGPLPVREACEYVRQAALGLQYAYEKGLVHRDIKPGNLMLQTAGAQAGTFGTIKLLDLGLAMLQQPLLDLSSSGPLTVAGKVVGTVDFIAPEQARDASSVDIRADLYSLGCTFYHLLVGQAPFDGATVTNKLFKHALEYPEPVERLRDDVPPAVAAVLRRLMAKKPEDRYQTPAELAAVLENILRGRPAPAVAPALTAPVEPPGRRAEAVPVAVPGSPAARRPVRRQWLWWNLAGLAVLLVMLGVLVLVLSRSLGGQEPSTGKEEVRQSPAEREAQVRLDELRQRRDDAQADRAKLRQDLAEFRWRYPGLTPTLQAMVLLRELPSPFDDLNPDRIPRHLRVRGQPPELVAVTPGAATAVQATPDGARVVTANGAAVTSRDLVNGTAARPFDRVRGQVQVVALSLDGKHALLGGKGRNLGLWDVTTGREVRKLEFHTADVTAVALAPDGRWGLSGGADRMVRLFEFTEGPVYSMDGHAGPVTGAAFTPDGKLALTASADRTLRTWDVAIRRELRPWVEAPEPLTCLALSPDGRRAYTGGARGVRRWSVGPVAADGQLDGYSGPVSSLALTADCRSLAACDRGGWVAVWDLASGKKVKEWKLPAALGLAWALDGRHLVVAGGPGGVYTLRVP